MTCRPHLMSDVERKGLQRKNATNHSFFGGFGKKEKKAFGEKAARGERKQRGGK